MRGKEVEADAIEDENEKVVAVNDVLPFKCVVPITVAVSRPVARVIQSDSCRERMRASRTSRRFDSARSRQQSSRVSP